MMEIIFLIIILLTRHSRKFINKVKVKENSNHSFIVIVL